MVQRFLAGVFGRVRIRGSAQAGVEVVEHGCGDGDGVVFQVGDKACRYEAVQVGVGQSVSGQSGFQTGAVFEFGDGVGHVAGVGKAGGAGQFV